MKKEQAMKASMEVKKYEMKTARWEKRKFAVKIFSTQSKSKNP